jgi:hypothetical protein
MIHYSFVPFHTIAEEVAKRIPEIYAGMNETYDKPNVDWEYYLAASHMGQCHALVATDGEMVGLSVFFIDTNANHKNLVEATNSLIFVSPSHRGKIDLIQKSEMYLKALGAHQTTYQIKDRRIGKLLARKGYVPEYIVWSKTHE